MDQTGKVMEAGKAIYSLLSNSTAVGNICGDRIYPEIAQQTAQTPFIIYTIQSATPSGSKTGTSTLDEVQFEIITFSEDYAQAMDLGTAARGALDRVGGVINGVQVQSIDFKTQGVDYDFTTNTHMLVQVYDMRIGFTGVAGSYNPINVVATYDAIQVEFTAQQKTGGTGAVVVQGTTPARLPFSVQDIKTSSIFDLASGATGIISVTGTGIYKITACVTFVSDGNNLEPHIFAKIETRELEAHGTAYIKGGSSNDHSTAVISQIAEITNTERVSLWAYEHTDDSTGVEIEHATLLIERMSST